MDAETGKRIVSKGAYMKVVGVKTALGWFSMLWIVMSVPLFIFAIGCMMSHDFAGLALIFFPCSIASGWLGVRLLQRSERIDPGVPLTRANTADLPAPDSLVRASEEPLQAQEAILLRAAAERQEKYEEQLVRAVEGQE